MKKINLNVVLEDNQLFEASVKEAILSQVKQITRETIDKELKAEIDRITTARLNELKNQAYYNPIINRITESLVGKLTKEIPFDNDKINAMIEEKVGSYLDARIKSRNGLEGFIQKYIDKSIANILLQNAKD